MKNTTNNQYDCIKRIEHFTQNKILLANYEKGTFSFGLIKKRKKIMKIKASCKLRRREGAKQEKESTY
jgi:hypothetical protein